LPLTGETEKKKKNFWLDTTLTCGVTAAFVAVNDDIRAVIFRKWSLDMVGDNFRDPLRRAGEGGERDHNGFLINYVSHPLSYACLALFLKDRGYSNVQTLLFTQVHNIVWEYIIEGGLWLPSSKDLLSDLAGALAGIFLLDPLSDLGECRIASERHCWSDHLLYWLNPFKKINTWIFGRQRQRLALALFPCRRGWQLRVLLAPRH
jgi:hypothetical protein